MHIFEIGELVYYDSMRGLVKCKIIGINWESTHLYGNVVSITPNSQKFILRVTARTHPIYKCGEIIESSRLWIIPRDKIYISQGIIKIKPY
jgi:hypothetical protein